MVDRLARPPAPQQPEYLLQHVAAPRAIEPERLALAGLTEAGDEAEQESAARDLIELGQLLGQQERVAAEGTRLAPRCSRRVRPAASDSPSSGSSTAATGRSDSHSPSNPASSSDSANAAICAPEGDPACGPTAKRIFMCSQPRLAPAPTTERTVTDVAPARRTTSTPRSSSGSAPTAGGSEIRLRTRRCCFDTMSATGRAPSGSTRSRTGPTGAGTSSSPPRRGRRPTRLVPQPACASGRDD